MKTETTLPWTLEEQKEQMIAAQIAKIQAQHQAAAEKAIEDYKLSFEVDQARKDLSNKIKSDLKALDVKHNLESKELDTQHNAEIQAFKTKYNTYYFPVAAPIKSITQSTEDKCKTVAAMVDFADRPKYKLNDSNEVVNLKGEPIKSTIVFKDVNGKKQTLAVSAFQSYLMNKKK